jgi:hypothetical protein
LDHSL